MLTRKLALSVSRFVCAESLPSVPHRVPFFSLHRIVSPSLRSFPLVVMAYASSPADHYRTSSLSHPANSPFAKTAAQQQMARSQAVPMFNSTQAVGQGSAILQQQSPQQQFAPSMTQSSPFSVRPELDPLEREKREIERRRQRLDDRKTRILHAKTRVMGVDVDALNEQVKERQERERLEVEREMYHDALSAHHSKILSGMEEERKVKERLSKEELNFYRSQQSAEKRTREQRQASGWHNMLDSTGSTFLQFTGEDLDKNLRTTAQATQQKDWLAQQLAMQADREARDRQDAADYATHQAYILQLKKQNEEDKAAQAVARLRGVQEYNLQVSAQKRQSAARSSAANQSANNDELANTLSSPLLNEVVQPSALGDHRTIPYGFKGFSAARRQEILEAQYDQAQQIAEKRVAQRLEEADYARQSEAVRREMIRADRAREEAERARLVALKDERMHQHKQKTLRDQYHNHVVYTNPVREEYFQQFGTSGR